MNYLQEAIFRFYSFNKSTIFSFINDICNLGFNIYKVVSDDEYEDDFQKRIAEGIHLGLIIKFKNNSSLHIVNVKNKDNIYLISLYFQWTKDVESGIISFVMSSNDIKYGYLSSYYDIKWQNEESIQSYNVNHMDTSKLSFTKDIFGNDCIDISKNFGREILVDNLILVAAYKSWINVEFVKIDLQKISKLHIAINKLPNRIYEITILDKCISDYNTVRDIQQGFISAMQHPR